jgi:DNA-binding MarR family transcriptional regulator
MRYFNVQLNKPAAHTGADTDHVDRVREQWARHSPELDTAPIGVVARIGRLQEYLDRGMERLFAEHGLSRSAWDVLASLRRTGSPYQLRPSDLADTLMRTSGAITHTLRRLEHGGLIERVSNPADLRNLFVRLTPAGKDLVDRVAPLHLANEQRMLAALSTDDREALAGLLRQLLITFERPDDRG